MDLLLDPVMEMSSLGQPPAPTKGGDYAGRFFCRRCGSSVFSLTGDKIEVNLGSLDAPDQLMPTYESWIIRRESWLPPFPLTRRYERDRDPTSRFEE